MLEYFFCRLYLFHKTELGMNFLTNARIILLSIVDQSIRENFSRHWATWLIHFIITIEVILHFITRGAASTFKYYAPSGAKYCSTCTFSDHRNSLAWRYQLQRNVFNWKRFKKEQFLIKKKKTKIDVMFRISGFVYSARR